MAVRAKAERLKKSLWDERRLDVFEAIRNRRSVRAYSDKNVSEEQVETIIEAARFAPSAGNIQPSELVIVRDAYTKQKLSKAALNQIFIEKASVVIVVFAELNRSNKAYGSRGVNLYCIQDTAAATQNIHLAAHALGLGTCWVGAFHENEVAEAVKAPNNLRPVVIIPVGYPDQNPSATNRRPVDEFVHYETF